MELPKIYEPIESFKPLELRLKTFLEQFSKVPDIQKTRLSEVLIDLGRFDVLKMTNLTSEHFRSEPILR